jgi:hypothetical protein
VINDSMPALRCQWKCNREATNVFKLIVKKKLRSLRHFLLSAFSLISECEMREVREGEKEIGEIMCQSAIADEHHLPASRSLLRELESDNHWTKLNYSGCSYPAGNDLPATRPPQQSLDPRTFARDALRVSTNRARSVPLIMYAFLAPSLLLLLLGTKT